MKRLDQVGSFLRPLKLKEARESYAKGEIDAAGLRAVEDECIAELVELEDKNGVYYISDGEFRRSWWHLDFYWGFNGVEKVVRKEGYVFKGIVTRAEGMKIVGKIDGKNHPFVKDFKDFKAIANQKGISDDRLKITIPSPSMLLYMLFIRGGIKESIDVYAKDYDSLKKDILNAYKDVYDALYEAGCRYIQLDDVSFGSFCDDNFIQGLKDNGIDANATSELYVDYLNESLKDIKDDVITGIHICRGNYRSHFSCSGGYEKVAKKLFGELKIKNFFLEFDTDRAGGFEPLRYVKDQNVVLGLLTTKEAKSPSLDELKQRANEAKKYVKASQIRFSTQCGFSSTEEGNEISYENQWDKIKLLVELEKELEKEGFWN